jgi:hypothetical protein
MTLNLFRDNAPSISQLIVERRTRQEHGHTVVTSFRLYTLIGKAHCSQGCQKQFSIQRQFVTDLDFQAALTTSATAVINPIVVSVKLIPA